MAESSLKGWESTAFVLWVQNNGVFVEYEFLVTVYYRLIIVCIM
jgi:hypothetical protein